MARRLLTVQVCLLAVALSAAMPTQNMTVVVTTDGPAPATVSPNSDSTSEGPPPAIKVKELEVESSIRMRYAHTAVIAHVRNPASRAQEAYFRVLLPETAFISGFVMTIDGKSYKAYVKEKEEAKQIYQSAVSSGLGAAHISTKARDSNHFLVSVNLEPLSSAIFNLTYEELLGRRHGLYSHAINLHPGTVVPKLTVTVNIKESQMIKVLKVPEIRTGNEIESSNDSQNSQAVIVKSEDGREATITFTPNLQEQERLMTVYAQKSKTSAADSQGVLGQFVVEYDVVRPKEGEILVNDGYFVHFLAPSELQPLNKHVVFVLDTSGSMYGNKMQQLKSAMKVILREFKPGDYFNIVEFSDYVKVHDITGHNQGSQTLVPPTEASPGTLSKAVDIIDRLSVGGMTNIQDALHTAVQLTKKGVESKPESINGSDTAVQEKSIILEPIIIFLTDGDPTVGEMNYVKISDHVTELNSGTHKASIFSLALGKYASLDFLRKISLRNGGFMRHIYEAADIDLQLRNFYIEVSSPLLANVKFTYPEDQIQENTLTKHSFRTLYAGSELVVSGRLADNATELSPRVTGYSADVVLGRKPFEFSTRAIVEQKHDFYPLERMWSYLTIKQLLDQKKAEEDVKIADQDENTPKKKALRLALQYSFVTPLTSLVVVKPNETHAADVESADNIVHSKHSYPIGRRKSSGYHSTHSYPSSSRLNVGHYSSVSASSYPSSTGLSGSQSSSYSGFSSYPRSSGLSFGHSSSVSGHSYPSGYGVSGGQAGSISTHSYPSSNRFGVGYSAGFASYPSSNVLISNNDQLSIGHGGNVYRPSYDTGRIAVGVSRGGFPTTTAQPPATTPTPKPILSDYDLLNFPWVEPLLDASTDCLVLPVNGTNVSLNITKDFTVPKGNDEACGTAVGGGEGLCVYLTRCSAARQITLDQYTTTFCRVNGGYAGVCCKQNDVDITAKTT